MKEKKSSMNFSCFSGRRNDAKFHEFSIMSRKEKKTASRKTKIASGAVRKSFLDNI